MKIPRTLILIGCGVATAINSVFSQGWTQIDAPNRMWTSIASSADGSKLVATSLGWSYYISTNSGTTWSSNREPQFGSDLGSWSCVASSADGEKFVAAAAGSIWASTNSGVNWTSNNIPGVSGFTAVASSADGIRLVAAAGGRSSISGPICVSTDSGSTWAQTTAPIGYWTSVASSADGTKLAATDGGSNLGTNGGSIYLSSDSGAHWAPASAPTNLNWSDIASSADGSKLVAVSLPLLINNNVVFAPIYTSTDSGSTWVSNNVPGGSWVSVACSADGNKLVAAAQQAAPNIFTSTNSGGTWASDGVPDDTLNSVAGSADGNKSVAVAVLGGGIYASQSTPAPQLKLTSSGSNFALSWIVPSAHFELQQNDNLNTASWVTLTNTPVLNFTNLQDEIALLPTGGSSFFRLISE